MGPVAKFLLFMLSLCPSVKVQFNSPGATTPTGNSHAPMGGPFTADPTTPTDYSQVPDFIEDLQHEIPDDDLISPAQQRIHYLEFCLALGSTDEPPLER